jgi:hypothetical protein
MRTFIATSAVLGLLLMAANVRADEPQLKKAPLDNVPKAVTDAAKAQFPQGQVTGATLREQNGQQFYDVKVKTGDREESLNVTPQGSIMQRAGTAPTTRASNTNQQRRRGLFARMRSRRGGS